MPGPAKAGALIYAKDLERLSHFYQTLLSMQLSSAEAVAASLGGKLFGQEYAGPGFKVRNGYDPEGNIFQVRENAT
jgi:predicted enzyme related to lactoylglutathione lyase